MGKETSLQTLLARVQAAHGAMHNARPLPPGGQAESRRASKPKPERPAIAEKVKDYFHAKFRHDPGKEALCDALFGCKVWPTEEILLEDLGRAKHEGDQRRITLLRDLVHANSWSSHSPPPPHDELMRRALRLRDDLQATQGSLARANPDDGRHMDEQLHESEVIIDALRERIDDERAEAATRSIEHWMDQAWHDLVIVRKTMPFSWERLRELRKTRPQFRAAVERIEAIREIRDQLYFQRLYPNLFREGKEPPHHESS